MHFFYQIFSKKRHKSCTVDDLIVFFPIWPICASEFLVTFKMPMVNIYLFTERESQGHKVLFGTTQLTTNFLFFILIILQGHCVFFCLYAIIYLCFCNNCVFFVPDIPNKFFDFYSEVLFFKWARKRSGFWCDKHKRKHQVRVTKRDASTHFSLNLDIQNTAH